MALSRLKIVDWDVGHFHEAKTITASCVLVNTFNPEMAV